MRLQNKIILVTGSTTGIGNAIARRFVEEGARVIIHGLEEAEGEATVDELGSANAVFLPGDLSDPEVPARLVSGTIDAFGGLHGVVNNAALVAPGTIRETDTELFDRILATNTRAPLFLIREALPHLAETRGAVLNIGSVNAYSGEPDLLPYSISKGALMTMTRSLGDTLHREDGVRVNQINPGWVLTESENRHSMERGLGEDWATDRPPSVTPAGRLIMPEEIAAAAVYWMSDEAGPISGSVTDLSQFPLIGRLPQKE